MSAITRKVEWLKLRELNAYEQEMVRKRYRLGKKMTTLKVQVEYTDQRIDGHHAPECEFQNERAAGAVRPDPSIDFDAVRGWAGKELVEEWGMSYSHQDHLIYVPAPCTCGIIRAEEYVDLLDGTEPLLTEVTKFIRPYAGLYATRSTPKYKYKGDLPTLTRFVPRPLTLAQALEFEEVEDVGAVKVLADAMLERGHPVGAYWSTVLFKHEERTA